MNTEEIPLAIERKAQRAARSARIGDVFLLIIPLAFLSIFFYYPLISILYGGLTDGRGAFTLGRVASILADGYYLRLIAFTVEQALLSTLASILLGLPGAYLMAKYEFRGKGVVKAITTVPFVLPSIIVVLGFVLFFGNNGILNRALMGIFRLSGPPLRVLYSMRAIVLAHAFYNFPICIRLVSAVWSRVNPDLERAARSLGAKGLRLFALISLPQIMPGVVASAALIFIFCFMSFAIVLVLGGGPKYSTIEVEVYRLAKVALDLKAGSALAIVESFLSVAFMYAYIKLQHRVGFAERVELRYEREKFSTILRTPMGIAAVLYLALAFAIIIAPMLAVVNYSFLRRWGWAGRTSYSLEWYRRIFAQSVDGAFAVSYITAIKNSVLFGFMVVLFALPLGTAIAYITTRRRLLAGRFFEALMMLPLGISSIILGLGYIKAYQNFPWEISGRWYAIVFAHTIIAYPFVIRAVSAVFRKINPSLLEAASSLGANRWKLFWKLELPLVRSGVVAGATFAFAISVGEINATLMLYNPRLTTIPIAIYRLISSYNYFAACAMGTILMAVCFGAFLLIEKMGFEVA
ncbi:MAG: ABC transporter permease [bacterium]